MLKNLTIQDFVDELATNSPAPGGGSAAALGAALAAALGSMVFSLTVGKKAYNVLNSYDREKVDKSYDKSVKLKEEFLCMMEKDAEEFLKLMSFFKLPKENESERSYRKQKIGEGYRHALEIPLELARKSVILYDDILVAAGYGNVNAISDAGVAALLLQASLESAVLNVRINLSGVQDETFKKAAIDECEKLVEDGRKKKDEIMSIVNSKIIL